MLIKHARLTPLCGDAFIDAFRQTRLPADLVASVRVDHDTITRLIARRAVDFISFTGSVWREAAQVYRQASAQLLDMGLELRRKGSGAGLRGCQFRFCRSQPGGRRLLQCWPELLRCRKNLCRASALTRRFVDAFVAEVRNYTMGDPGDPATGIGPLAQLKALDVLKLSGRLTRRSERGAEASDRRKTGAGPGIFF